MNKYLVKSPCQITCYYNHHVHPQSSQPTVGVVPHRDSYSLQYSIHTCPLILRDEIAQLFPHLTPADIKARLLIIPVIQHTLSTPFDSLSEEQFGALRSDFVSFARQVVNKIKMRQQQQQHVGDQQQQDDASSLTCGGSRSGGETVARTWTDFLDPASGQPVHSKASMASNYTDANLFQVLLKYSTETTRDSSSIVVHPVHGVNVFPSVIFTTAPADVVEQVIDEIASIRPCNCHR